MADLYTTKAALVIGADLAQQQPLVCVSSSAPTTGITRRASIRSPKVRCASASTRAASLIAAPAQQLDALESLRGELREGAGTRHPLRRHDQGRWCAAAGRVRRFARDSGEVRLPGRLLQFARRRRIWVCCRIWDRAISRCGPGHERRARCSRRTDLDVLWVVGANPLKIGALRSQNAFVVVQEMFLTETAQRADVIFPAASAYEKDGHRHQRDGRSSAAEARALTDDGHEAGSRDFRAPREGNGRQRYAGAAKPDVVFEEIRRSVRGYNVPLPVIAYRRRGADHAAERPCARAVAA